ncbi:MAG: hypothetical protein WD049_09060 [Candidatus Paceibacterota bacterium]
MSRCITIVGAVLVIWVCPQIATADSLSLAPSPLVDHPVQHPLEGRSGAVWRSRTGAWGENLAEETLRLRGFNEIHEIKNGAGNGIDRIAIKRGIGGGIIEAKFVEVKTTRASKPKLGDTRYGGVQMSRRWLASNLSQMRRSGDGRIRTLALELSQFRKASGRPIESLGELIHVNPRTLSLSGYSPDGTGERYSESIERLLENVRKHTGSRDTRYWAGSSLSVLPQVRSSDMSSWLGKSVSEQSSRELVRNSGRATMETRSAILRSSHSVTNTKALRGSAGRISVLVALTLDAKDSFDTENAYRRGVISVRQRNVQHATTLGGMAGAYMGAYTGVAAGAWLGTFGGPFAYITVPAGGLLGGAIGGIAGYTAGSSIAEYGAMAWYRSIDTSVKDKFEVAWLESKCPSF